MAPSVSQVPVCYTLQSPCLFPVLPSRKLLIIPVIRMGLSTPHTPPLVIPSLSPFSPSLTLSPFYLFSCFVFSLRSVLSPLLAHYLWCCLSFPHPWPRLSILSPLNLSRCLWLFPLSCSLSHSPLLTTEQQCHRFFAVPPRTQVKEKATADAHKDQTDLLYPRSEQLLHYRMKKCFGIT